MIASLRRLTLHPSPSARRNQRSWSSIRNGKTPADVIYKVTKAIVEGRDAFGHVSSVMKGTTPQHFAESFGMPRHPGAERYYREAGLLK